MEDYIILAILVVIIGAAATYIIRAKKNGAKCIGCPAGGNCTRHKTQEGDCCGCGCGNEEKESGESCCCNCQNEK